MPQLESLQTPGKELMNHRELQFTYFLLVLVFVTEKKYSLMGNSLEKSH